MTKELFEKQTVYKTEQRRLVNNRNAKNNRRITNTLVFCFITFLLLVLTAYSAYKIFEIGKGLIDLNNIRIETELNNIP